METTSIDLHDVDQLWVRVSVKAGASGFTPAGTPLDGFAVEAFIEGRWQELGRVAAAPVMTPVETSFEVGPLNPSAIATTLMRIAVRVVPLGGAAVENARLAVDALEVQVRFTRR